MRAVALAYALALIVLVAMFPPAGQAQSGPDAEPTFYDDAFVAPPPSPALLASVGTLRGPSQFMAGDVVVLMVLPESNGALDPSTEDWTPEQIAAVTRQVQAGLDWWVARLPAANLRFILEVRVVPTAYEPTSRPMEDEGLWIGDTLRHLGFGGSSYFDQAYDAADALRQHHGADWGTVLFVPNSANGNGHLADGRFAYAYINGPLLVITSDAGGYGLDDMAAVVAHELGHTFGALDQYAAARISCQRRSGYLSTPTSNSQFGGCGTRLPSIMLDATGAFAMGMVDPSALHQIGYRDSDGDGIIDPLDTTPALDLQQHSLASGTGRPVIRGMTRDIPFPSDFQNDVTLNTIQMVEYRVDDGPWIPTLPTDGAFDSEQEGFSAELPLYDGSYTVEVRAVNSAGAVSPASLRQLEVTWIGPAPRYGVSAPAATASDELVLALEGPAGTDAVQLSEDAAFGDAAWQPFGPTVSYRLGAGEGPRTIYVRFRDQFGLVSLPATALVVVDTEPPQGSAKRPSANPSELLLDARDERTTVTDVEVRVGEAAPRWMAYAPSLMLPEAGSEQAVTVRFRDAAGNVSPPVAARVGYSVSLPLVRR